MKVKKFTLDIINFVYPTIHLGHFSLSNIDHPCHIIKTFKLDHGVYYFKKLKKKNKKSSFTRPNLRSRVKIQVNIFIHFFEIESVFLSGKKWADSIKL